MMCIGVNEGCCVHLINLWELFSVNLGSVVLDMCTDTGYLLMIRCSSSAVEDVNADNTEKPNEHKESDGFNINL